jgi:hypothetical protein
MKKPVLSIVCSGAILAMTSIPAMASLTATLTDTYTGGIDPYAFTPGAPSTALDSVGGGDFNVSSAAVSRTSAGLSVTVNTNYAGHSGEAGTTYGDLLLSSSWNPISTTSATTLYNDWKNLLGSTAANGLQTLANQTVASDNAKGGYLGDVYQTGEWSYAVKMTGTPTTKNGVTTGTVALYKVLSSAVVSKGTAGGIVLSNADAGDDYREGEAVQYDPIKGQTAISTGTYTINPDKSITYNFNDNNLLGNNFAISWAMTCANDIIQGKVSLPEPGGLALLAFGFLGLAGVRWQAKRSRAV